MDVLLWAAFLLAAACYASACVLFVMHARARAADPIPAPWPAWLLATGAALQLVYLVLYAIADRRCPIYSLHTALAIVSIAGVVTYSVLRRDRNREALGGFVSGSALLFLLIARAIADNSPPPVHRWLMAIHVTSNLLGGGLLLIAGCASAFYIWNERRLRNRRKLGQGAKLPPLESLDAVVHRLLWIGLPLLTLGLFTGRLVIRHVEAITVGDRLRAILAEVSWVVLAVVLGLRIFSGWRGRRPAYATLAGAVGILLVILLYVGRALLAEGL